MPRIAFVLLACASAACLSRPAGPNADEYGKVSYWMINSASEHREQCSDAPEWASLRAQRAHADPNDGIVWYLEYALTHDGRTAELVDCARFSTGPCDHGLLPLMAVEGHVVSGEIATEEVPLGTGCTAVVHDTLTVTDEGVEGHLQEKLHVTLSGETEACAQAEAALKARSPNREGVTTCVIAAEYGMAFSHARDAELR